MSECAAPRACIACGATPHRSFRLSNGARLLRCPRCRLGWWDWPTFEPPQFYDREYFQGDRAERGYDDYAALETGLRRTARARLRRIARVVAQGAPVPGKRLLDVGCGTGVFVAESMNAGWDARGIEISEYAVNKARERGLFVTCGSIEDVGLEAGAFDCITLWDVLEHLRDPADVLMRCARALRPGGIVALSTGDVTSLCARLSGSRWHLFTLPEHLFFFSPRSLRLLLRRAACRIVCLTRETNWVPVAYLFERLRKSLGFRVPCAGVGDRWVVPANLFDVLGVYAVRRGGALAD